MKMGDLNNILAELKTFTMHKNKKINKLYELTVITEQNRTVHGQQKHSDWRSQS